MPKWAGCLVITGGFAALILVIYLAGRMTSKHQYEKTTEYYNPNRICDDAMDAAVDFSNDKATHEDVVMHPNCWSAWVKLPKWWSKGFLFGDYYAQPTGDIKGFWAAIWQQNGQPRGTWNANMNEHFQSQGMMLRVQGHGTLRFFTNSVPDQTQTQHAERNNNPAAEDDNPEKSLSYLSIHTDQEAHVCDKPPDAYFPGSSGFTFAKFLFDSRNDQLPFGSYTKVNWAHGFTGRVFVCFVVNEKGLPIDITFLHRPHDDIAKHIETWLGGLRFEPGRDPDQKPISMIFAWEFEFSSR